jgi:hypothetical protein
MANKVYGASLAHPLKNQPVRPAPLPKPVVKVPVPINKFPVKRVDFREKLQIAVKELPDDQPKSK